MQKAVVRFVGGLLLAFGVLGIVSIAQAETAKLKLVTEIPKVGKKDGKAYPREYYFRGRTQAFANRITTQKDQVDPAKDPRLKEFNELVKKEPAYVAEQPMKGVIEFGGKRHAFAMDAMPEEEKESDEAPKGDAKKEDDLSTAEPTPNLLMNRLYLDRNGNGDLTDDEVLTPENKTNTYRIAQSSFTFALPIDGVDIPCRFDVSSNTARRRLATPDGKSRVLMFKRCYASFSTNCFREGEITLGDKTYRILLIDYNNNGTFNDPYKKGYPCTSGEFGDQAYIIPADLENPRFTSTPFFAREGLVTPAYLGPVMGQLDGKYWNMKLTPSGDTLTMTPFEGTVGYIEKPGQPFSLRVFEKKAKSLLFVNSDENGKAALPPGEWELLAYTMDFEKKKPVDEDVDDDDEKEDADDVKVTKGEVTCILIGRPNATLKVTAAEATELKFGPPYTVSIRSSIIKAGARRQLRSSLAPSDSKGDRVVRLSLSMSGSQGERCSDVLVDGKRPAKPTFVITTKDGKEVESGAFEYG